MALQHLLGALLDTSRHSPGGVSRASLGSLMGYPRGSLVALKGPLEPRVLWHSLGLSKTCEWLSRGFSWPLRAEF